MWPPGAAIALGYRFLICAAQIYRAEILEDDRKPVYSIYAADISMPASHV